MRRVEGAFARQRLEPPPLPGSSRPRPERAARSLPVPGLPLPLPRRPDPAPVAALRAGRARFRPLHRLTLPRLLVRSSRRYRAVPPAIGPWSRLGIQIPIRMRTEAEALGEATPKRQLPLLADAESGVPVLQSTILYTAAGVAVIKASGRPHAISEHRAEPSSPSCPGIDRSPKRRFTQSRCNAPCWSMVPPCTRSYAETAPSRFSKADGPCSGLLTPFPPDASCACRHSAPP